MLTKLKDTPPTGRRPTKESSIEYYLTITREGADEDGGEALKWNDYDLSILLSPRADERF